MESQNFLCQLIPSIFFSPKQIAFTNCIFSCSKQVWINIGDPSVFSHHQDVCTFSTEILAVSAQEQILRRENFSLFVKQEYPSDISSFNPLSSKVFLCLSRVLCISCKNNLSKERITHSSLMFPGFIILPFITCAGNLKVSRFTSDIARSLNLKERKNN